MGVSYKIYSRPCHKVDADDSRAGRRRAKAIIATSTF
jgi:hypothetical protein